MTVSVFTMLLNILRLRVWYAVPLAIAFVLLEISPAGAQFRWEQTSGPEGGLIASVTVDSQHRVFAAGAFGGAFESIDRGGRWFSRNNGLPTFHLKQMESSSTGYIFASTFSDGLFRYHFDDRPIWEALPDTKHFGVFTGLAATPNGHVFGCAAQTGLLRSTDSGTTWRNSSRGLLTANDSDIRYLSANSKGDLAAVSGEGRVFLSTDDGLNWQKLAATPSKGRASAIAMDANRDIYYGDDHGGLYLTTDAGNTWSKPFSSPTSAGIVTLAFDRVGGYAYSWDHDGYLFRSLNVHQSWTKIDSVTSDGDFFGTAIDSDGTLYIGTDFEGVLRSRDSGESLQSVNGHLIANLTTDIAVDKKNTVFALTENYVWRSSDRGDNWTRLGFQIGASLALPPLAIDSQDHIYVGTDFGLFVSFDHGDTWLNQIKPVAPNIANLCRSVAIDKDGFVYAAMQTGIYISYDNGHNFVVAGSPAQTEPQSSIIIGQNGGVYAVNDQGRVLRGENIGFQWTDLGLAPGLSAVDTSGGFYAISNREISFSKDTTKTWTTLHPRIIGSTSGVFNVYLDRKGQVFAATDSGIYRLNPDGVTWTSTSIGLQDPSATRLSAITTICEDRSSNYYAASRGQGVFRSLPAASVTATGISNTRLKVFPNPADAHAIIQLDSGHSPFGLVRIFNSAGSCVRLMNAQALYRAADSFTMDTQSLPAGVYRVAIEVNGRTESAPLIISH